MVKIAIQANPNRGKEIISLLESFGGIKSTLEGNGEFYTYYIDKNNVIRYNDAPKDYKVYTLEEFEEEFPFKVGDKVIHSYTPNFVGTVVDIKFDDHIPYRVDIAGKICTCGTTSLKPYKEMKEERNIILTLDKAKEWYKKGGDLKQVALQAFTEKELNPLPRSWEEFCLSINKIHSEDISIPLRYRTLRKLEILRDIYRQGWKPDWLEGNVQKYVIQKWRDRISIETTYVTHSFLSFPTYEMAEEFLKYFRDLIEKAGDLI